MSTPDPDQAAELARLQDEARAIYHGVRRRAVRRWLDDGLHKLENHANEEDRG